MGHLLEDAEHLTSGGDSTYAKQKSENMQGGGPMTKRSSSVFDDLTALPAGEVEAMYERTVERLARSEEVLVRLHVQKNSTRRRSNSP